jgi:membrane-associated phospholipid phosphatase
MSGTRSTSERRIDAAWLAIVLASLAGAIVLTIAILNKVPIPYDKSLLALATSWGAWELAWNVLSEMGNYPMIPIGLGFVVWLWWTKHRREAVLVAIILAAATIGSESLKAITARPRPSGPVPGIPGIVYSYPSGHALEDVMILGMLSVRLWRSRQARWLKIGFAALSAVLCVLIGIARVALNVHYPSDILAGFLGGLICLGWYAYGTREGAWASQPGTSLAGFHVARPNLT